MWTALQARAGTIAQHVAMKLLNYLAGTARTTFDDILSARTDISDITEAPRPPITAPMSIATMLKWFSPDLPTSANRGTIFRATAVAPYRWSVPGMRSTSTSKPGHR
jgi:hypothetical protein